MLQLTTGTFPQIETALLEDVIRHKQQDALGELLVISPSGHMLTRLQLELSLQLPAALNIHFMSFYGLADRLLSEGPASAEQIVSEPALFVEAIRELLEGKTEVEFKLRDAFLLKGRPLSRGLPAALAGTLRDLRDSGTRVVDALGAALEGHLGDAAPEAAPTLELYARLYEVLQARGLRTHADQLRRAAERVPKSDWIQRQKKIYLYGFYDLTGVQLDLVLAFAKHPAAAVYCPYVEGNAAYEYAERLIKDPAFTSKLSPSPRGRRDVLAASPSPASRERMELHGAPTLSREAGESVSEHDVSRTAREGDSKVEVWNCSGTQDEIWLASKKMLELVAGGIPPSEILLTARTLRPYVSGIRETLEAHHLPYAMAAEEPVGAYPLIKAARQMISLSGEDFPFGMTFDVLKSPYFAYAATLPDLDVSRAERVARQAGIVSGWESWTSRLRHWTKSDPPTEFLESISSTFTAAQARETAKGLRSVIEALHKDLVAGEDAPAPWSAHASWGRHLLERWLKVPKEASREESILWKGLLDSLSGLETLDALGSPVSRERFLEVWQDKLDKLSLALAPSGNAGVQVVDVMGARGLRFRAVVLLGMNEKSFPRLIREDPFLSDAARGALAQALGSRLGRKLDGYKEERLLLELALEMATERLILTYQRSDEEGKALIPSLYLHEIPAAKAPQHLPRTFLEKWGQVPLTSLTPKELSIMLNREAADVVPAYKALGFDLPLYQAMRQAQNELESFKAPLGPRDGVTGPSAKLKEVMAKGFSPASLQALAECPFRYYSSKILALAPLDEVATEGDLAADATGKLIHKVLEVFHQKLSSSPAGSGGGPKFNGDPPSAATGDDALNLLDEACTTVFESFQETAADLYPLAWKATQMNIRTRLHDFLDADLEELSQSGFLPTLFEQDVDGAISEFDEKAAGIRFHGRIDRVDTKQAEGGAQYRIVDYKTGRPSPKGKTETAILRGRYFQLPIYMSLAKAEVEKRLGKSAMSAGAAFYNMADWEKGVASPAIGADFWQNCGKELRENIQGLVALIEKGHFYIRPSEENGYCSWCRFSESCRKEHKPTAMRSENDPARLANDERLSRSAP